MRTLCYFSAHLSSFSQRLQRLEFGFEGGAECMLDWLKTLQYTLLLHRTPPLEQEKGATRASVCMVKYDNNAKTPEETANSKQQEHIMQRRLGREPIKIIPAYRSTSVDISIHVHQDSSLIVTMTVTPFSFAARKKRSLRCYDAKLIGNRNLVSLLGFRFSPSQREKCSNIHDVL